MNTKRVFYLDFLRVIMVFFVVLLHTAGREWGNLPVTGFDWNILNAFDGLVRFAVPVLVMISGAIFLSPEKEVTISSVWKKYIPRIAAAFVFWSLIFALVSDPTPGFSRVYDLIGQFLCGHEHMWYLYMFAGLYIVTPFLRRICEDKKLTEYFLVLSFVFAILITFILKFSTFTIPNAILSKLKLNMVLGFTGYYVLGYYISRIEISRKTRRFIYAFGILGAVSVPLCTALASCRSGTATENFYSYYSPACLLAAAAVFTAASYGIRPENYSPRARHLIRTVTDCSLGIYLSHELLLILIYKTGLTITFLPAALSVPLFTVAVYALSLLLTYLLKKIPFAGKYIV